MPEFVDWCSGAGTKLQDDSIDTAQIANVLIPEEVKALPDKPVLSLEWPYEILHQAEECVVLSRAAQEYPASMFDIELVKADVTASAIDFRIISAEEIVWGDFRLAVGGAEGFAVVQTSGAEIKLVVGTLASTAQSWLSSYPPLVRFVDLSELDGNLLIRPQHPGAHVFPPESFDAWDWSSVDVTKESIWKNGQERLNSIQAYAAKQFIDIGFEVVFDDDSPGESADLVCLA